MFERTSSTETFARALAASLEQFLGSAQATRQQVDRALEIADLPSRSDFAALAARIDVLTNAVDALEEAVRALAAMPEPKPGPKRRTVAKKTVRTVPARKKAAKTNGPKRRRA